LPKSNASGKSYHHGDLRAALLEAGETVLAATGVAGFSLRQVARAVGVSHSAPSHHFGDARGLLAALATEGFRRFLTAMRGRQADAGADPRELLLASGYGYLDFARSSPALFRLMFADEIAIEPTDELSQAREAAFDHLVRDVERLVGHSPYENDAAMVRVMASWSFAHGFAELLISGRMKSVQSMSIPEQELFFKRAFEPLLG